MGQEQARGGQNSRIEGQLERIEQNTKLITDLMPGVRDRPPPLPKKDDDSPPSSPSSTASTARPVTPPPYMSADSVQRQFDDMRNMLGALIGRTNDIAEQVSRAREFEIIAPRPELARIEGLLRKTLSRLGDSEMNIWADPKTVGVEQPPMAKRSKPPSSIRTETGSMYGGSEGTFFDQIGAKVKVPASSFHENYDPSRKRWTGIPESLLDGDLPSPDFDAEFQIANLPPDTPPEEYELGRIEVPDFIRGVPRQNRSRSVPPEEYKSNYEQTEYGTSPQQPPQPFPKDPSPVSTSTQPDVREHDFADIRPVPVRQDEIYDDEHTEGSVDDDYRRGPSRPAPPPQPVHVPAPVRSPGNLPPNQGPPGPGMMPPFAPGMSGMPGMPGPMGMPPPPGMGDMPRPNMPRIAGVRDPISTT